ncbi:MAG: GNAT family N-acetyltransferase [Lentisphaerae bacterium]|nr:GNAT family N-acetyltransferase [Lentisphaerota bacterium]
MTPTDLPVVVAVHGHSFPGFFLTVLGPRFLTLLYRSIAADDGGLVLVAVQDERLLGFAAGVLEQRGFYRRLIRRHLVAFALAASGAALRHPAAVPRLFRALTKPADAQQAAAPCCLMSLAVAPDCQGRGIGSALVRAFCDAMTARGASAISLTTDAAHNDAVNAFYARAGFRHHRQYSTPEGRIMNEYLRITTNTRPATA